VRENFKKAALLIEGVKDIFQAKMAVSLLRYRPDAVHCLIDSTKPGSTARQIFQIGGEIPVKNSIAACIKDIDALVLCMVLPEGKVPESWSREIVTALESGINIINGLHTDFGKIDAITNKLGGLSPKSDERHTRFNKAKGSIFNIRIPPEDIELFKYDVLKTRGKRVLTVGSDCNIGKMVTTLEMTGAAKKRGVNAGFIATGQIGMLIKGSGIAVDRVISDFLPGAVERLIKEEGDRDIYFIEGQGSIIQPMYSGVSLGLLHGASPDCMILCHAPNREYIRYSNIKIPDITFIIRLHEELARITVPSSRVTGIALNCFDMDAEAAGDVVKEYEDRLGLPVTDVLKFGAEKLINSIQ
jgi:uncharacterized NAD-dependent epimerase/dehydratase family protein